MRPSALQAEINKQAAAHSFSLISLNHHPHPSKLSRSSPSSPENKNQGILPASPHTSRSCNHGSHGEHISSPHLVRPPNRRRQHREQKANRGRLRMLYRRLQEPPEERRWGCSVPLLLHCRSRRGQEDGGLQHRHEEYDAQPLRVPPRSRYLSTHYLPPIRCCAHRVLDPL